jgi:hypothetical protein
MLASTDTMHVKYSKETVRCNSTRGWIQKLYTPLAYKSSFSMICLNSIILLGIGQRYFWAYSIHCSDLFLSIVSVITLQFLIINCFKQAKEISATILFVFACLTNIAFTELCSHYFEEPIVLYCFQILT